MPTAPACAIVIFGASGDLAKRKLIPALFELARENTLNDASYLVGYSRSPMTDEQYRQECYDAIKKFARNGMDEALWKKLEPRISYQSGDYGDAASYAKLADSLNGYDKQFGGGGNRLFYLSTPPAAFEPIITQLGQLKPAGNGDNGSGKKIWQRIIIEKPFGRDLDSAKKLNALLHKYFEEEQIYRIDHYLGKETVQNLMVLRFANAIFEPLWNHKYIDHVQITVSETLGVGKRGGYYNSSGALRDMVQNHMFQLMALAAMEPPTALDAVSIRDEKVKVFRSIRRINPERVDDFVVRAQYGAGEAGGESTPGYLKEKDVPAESGTETFAALKLYIDNWRWSGTPFYLRTGKSLSQKVSEIAVRFRSPPQTLFQRQCDTQLYPNDLIIRVQPDEGISWRINGKVPGGQGQLNIKPVALDFLYKTTFNVEPPEAYERLISDATFGDQTLFIRGDEAEAAWAVVDPIEQGWAMSKKPPAQYAPGSWGPKRAQDLIENDGRRWLHTGGEVEPIIACSL
ncbi:MAG TPA: glucose-6-phosphate dehydrogenase [Tepidisphaeraceae bacterium]|jgi:glucose-6-phosphate 1-dehydrogenase|nr:glucose-6-phosphate dehydrogenase [Tepidisphaeraceae bacterium]